MTETNTICPRKKYLSSETSLKYEVKCIIIVNVTTEAKNIYIFAGESPYNVKESVVAS